jgi:Enoyl-CoA hydratase/isomerase
MAEDSTASLVEYACKDQVATLTLNRPQRLNAFNDELVRHLADALRRFDLDPESKVAVICGNGRAFSSGADVHQRQLHSPMCKTALAFTIHQPETACHLATTRGPSYKMDCGSSKIEEGLQAHCKNQPSVHGQLAGISNLNPRGPGTRFYKIGGAERSRQCGACRIRRQALLLARARR